MSPMVLPNLGVSTTARSPTRMCRNACLCSARSKLRYAH